MPKESIILEELHSELKTNMQLAKKLKQESVIMSFLNIKSNDRLRLLRESSMDLGTYLLGNYKDLIDNEYIRETDKENEFHITAKGIWQVEQGSIISIDDLIGYIDKNFFTNNITTKNVNSKEKIILLGLIIARAFTKDNSLDLNMGEYALDSCKIILDKSNELLDEVNIITKLSEDKLYKKKGNEHIISNLIRHTDLLPKKTKLIFTAPGQQKYYLDLVDNGNINKQKLSYIFEVIFGKENSLTFSDVLSINDQMHKLTYDQSTSIYNDIIKSFVTPVYDDVIKEALLEGVLDFY